MNQLLGQTPRLNVKLYGQPVDLDGFYGGKSPFYVQPFASVMGHFRIEDILAKAGRTLEEMKQKAAKEDKNQLHMDVEFWYESIEPNKIKSKHKFYSPTVPYYFDFTRNILIMDF